MARVAVLLVRPLALAATFLACGDTVTPFPEDPEEVSFEVIHIGSDATLDLRGKERLERVPVPLAQADVDVVCIQGVGDPVARAALKKALVNVFPISLDLPTDDDAKVDDPRDVNGIVPPLPSKPPCAGLDASLALVKGCLTRTSCYTKPDEPLTRAVCLENETCMPDSLFTADPERLCRSCISSHGRSGATVAEIFERCQEQAHPLSVHGQHGMMILSKLPLSRPSLHVLPSEGTRRAVIGATATTPRGSAVDVFCATLGTTHASALPTEPRATEPYPGPYGPPRDGWLRENELQIEKLITHVTTRRGDRPAVVLGNFGVSAEVRSNGVVVLPVIGAIGAARLAERFAPGIAASYTLGCTVCLDNPLVGADVPSFENRIYLAGLPSTAVRSSVRSYLGYIVAAEQTTGERPVPISMQYGFRSSIAIPRP